MSLSHVSQKYNFYISVTRIYYVLVW